MPAILAPHVHAAAVGEDLVLLDVQADAYFCVPGGVSLLGLDGRRTFAPEAVGALADLAAAGLLAHAADLAPQPAPPLHPVRPATGSPRLRPRDAVALLGAFVDYLFQFRLRRFAGVLEAARRGRRSSPTAGAAETERLAAVFQQAAVWLPIPGQCLARSFVLLRFLQRSGADAVWVFGVQTWPFAAHCWLQHGSVALDDAPERLAPYEPILAV